MARVVLAPTLLQLDTQHEAGEFIHGPNLEDAFTHGAIRARQRAAQDTGVVGAQRARAVAGLVLRYLRCVYLKIRTQYGLLVILLPSGCHVNALYPMKYVSGCKF